jgi:serine/threonine-protein kinase
MLVHAWRILRKLGEGGYGYVYLVELSGLEGEPYTLKLSKFRQGEGEARSEKELALLSLVEHPNIVRVWGHGRWPHPARGWHYLVMEYVEGLHIWRWLETHNPTPREATRMVAALAQALAAVHQRGAVHRDVKGDNVIVRASDGQPVLLDFGVGDLGSSRTITLAVLPPGTTHYRSPEALRFLRESHGQEAARYAFQPADDLYALGVLFYRLLVDEYPFSPNLPPDLLYADIESRAPRAPTSLNPRVPAALSDLCMKLLGKRPEERPASAEALDAALRSLLEGADAAWDVPLFEDEPTPSSRTTEEEAPASASRHHRVPRRRNGAGAGASSSEAPHSQEFFAPALLTQAAPSSASRPHPKELAAELRTHRRLLSTGGLLALCVLLFIATRVGRERDVPAPLLSAPVQEQPAPRPPSPSPVAVAPTTRPEVTAPVKSPEKPLARPPTQPKPEKNLHALLKPCFAAVTSASLLSACASVPAVPESPKFPEDCPPEVVRAMYREGLKLNELFTIHLDIQKSIDMKRKDAFPAPKVPVKTGPVLGRLDKSGSDNVFPFGTLFTGYIWTDADPEFIYGRYTEALLPDGRKIPICLMVTDIWEMGKDPVKGVRKRSGSRPGATLSSAYVGVILVERYDGQ